MNSGQDREGFADALGPFSSPCLYGCAFVPFGRVMHLIYNHPHIRQLHLDRVTVHLPGPTSTLSQVPWFSLLESLTIKPQTTQTYDGGLVMADLLYLLARMPRLRHLGVYGPKGRERADKAVQYRDLPCSLETLVLSGILPVPAAAHIIAQSRRTLRELKISFLGHTDAEEALLVSAIAQAAPRLRALELRAGGARQLRSRGFATLARLDTLYLEVPRQVALQAVLDSLCGAPVRALSVQSTHDVRTPREPSHVDVGRLRMPSLRSIVFLGFAFDDDVRRDLVAYMQARRIRCHFM